MLIALPPRHPLAVEILEQRLGVLAACRERVAETGDRNRAIPLAERDYGLPGPRQAIVSIVNAGTHAHDPPLEREAVEGLTDGGRGEGERLRQRLGRPWLESVSFEQLEKRRL